MSANTRDLYCELLIKCLSNVIYSDPSIQPGTGQHTAFQEDLRSIGYDWPSVAHSMAGLKRLENVRELTQRVIDEAIAGDLIETGVWRGGCSILMRGVLAANGDKTRRVYVADSFEGLPPPDVGLYPQDDGDILYSFKDLAISEVQVRANFASYDLLDEQVVFVKGFFRDTLPSLDAGPFSLIRLDGDMYESTIIALDSLYPKLTPGGYVIIDDYGAILQCKNAVTDFRTKHGIDAEITMVDWTGAWWRKPLV